MKKKTKIEEEKTTRSREEEKKKKRRAFEDEEVYARVFASRYSPILFIRFHLPVHTLKFIKFGMNAQYEK